jgi:hypothetical protein
LERSQDQNSHEEVKEGIQNEAPEDTEAAGAKHKKSSPPGKTDKVFKATNLDQATKAHNTEEPKATASPERVLRFLLSDAALDICRPEDEIQYV